MDELDKLKDAWKSQDYSKHKVSTTDIYKMLHAKSSSYVKWIFYISIAELSLGLLVNIIAHFNGSLDESTKIIKETGYYNYFLFASYLSTGVVLYFIYRFYKVYREIEVSDSTKRLMNTILESRRVVKQYINFNLIFAFIIIEFSLMFGVAKVFAQRAIEKGETTSEIPLKIYILGGLASLLFGIILIGIFWLFYRLLYGILLKRLKKNYKELEQLDK